ncbi:MAG: class I SAM-dependent methyltransferase [Alphaproteobacteria bacterium]
MENKDFWNERFAIDEYAYGKEANQFLQSAVQYIPNRGKVLSIAEGEGRNGVFLAKQNLHVTAIDIAEEGKRKAEQLAAENHVSLDYKIIHADNFDLGDNEWDAIISIFGYLAPNSSLRKAVFQKIITAIKPNGVFILEAYHPKQIHNNTGGGKNPDSFMTKDEILATFPIPNILHLKEVQRNIIEGQYHTGLSDTTQLIWKK